MKIMFRKYINNYTCAWVAKKREDFSSSSSPMRNSILAKIPEQTKQANASRCVFDFHTIFSDLIDSLPLPPSPPVGGPHPQHNNGLNPLLVLQLQILQGKFQSTFHSWTYRQVSHLWGWLSRKSFHPFCLQSLLWIFAIKVGVDWVTNCLLTILAAHCIWPQLLCVFVCDHSWYLYLIFPKGKENATLGSV